MIKVPVGDHSPFDRHVEPRRICVDCLQVPARVNDVALAGCQVANEVDQIRERGGATKDYRLGLIWVDVKT